MGRYVNIDNHVNGEANTNPYFQMSHRAVQRTQPNLQKLQYSQEMEVSQPLHCPWPLLTSANEAGSKAKTPGLDTSLEPSSTSQSLKLPAGRHPRTPRRAGAQPVRLQAIDDSLGPLGPLGDHAPAATNDLPPLPPQKEQVVQRQPAGWKFGSQPADVMGKSIDSNDPIDDVEQIAGPRIPPPVQPSQGAPVRRDTQPSMSIEQAAKPSFDISVGDPHKVGDLTSSHIVYLVKTKV